MRTFMTFAITVVLLAVLTIPMMAATTHTGGGVSRVTVVTETNALVTQSTTFVQLPGAVVHITVPAGTTQLIRASFTAESQCSGETPGNWCSVRIVAVNAAVQPQSCRQSLELIMPSIRCRIPPGLTITGRDMRWIVLSFLALGITQ